MSEVGVVWMIGSIQKAIQYFTKLKYTFSQWWKVTTSTHVLYLSNILSIRLREILFVYVYDQLIKCDASVKIKPVFSTCTLTKTHV